MLLDLQSENLLVLASHNTCPPNDPSPSSLTSLIPTSMSQCPIQHSEPLTSSASARCPVAHGSDEINPLNQVPLSLSQTPATTQSMALSVERERSSIPCATFSEQDPSSSASSNWVYPSPQQFYNALVRKGYDMPQEQMSTMVQLHNFLNEEAWAEVLAWERRWSSGFVIRSSFPSVLRPS